MLYFNIVHSGSLVAASVQGLCGMGSPLVCGMWLWHFLVILTCFSVNCEILIEMFLGGSF